MNKYINYAIRTAHILSYRIRGILKSYHPNVNVDGGLICESNVELNTYYGGKIIIGSNCELRSGCKLLTYGGDIILGHHCSVNPYTMIYGQGNITIGNYVRIATQCVLIPSNHNYSDPDTPITFQGLTNIGIIIEDDVWLGCGVRVLDGVKIEKGCVIGAGSVVTKSTVPFGIYVGVPAKLIGKRGSNIN